jgi:hypothetical protein
MIARIYLANSTRHRAYRANVGAIIDYGILAEVRAPFVPGELGAGGVIAS